MKSIVLFGSGGYAINYVDILLSNEYNYNLIGIVDPFVDNSPKYELIKERNIEIYKTKEEFYSSNNADVAIIVTPLPLHLEMIEYCLKHNSDVLCEKPIVPTINDLPYIEELVKETNKKLAIGFQWNYLDPINKVKKDFKEGLYGNALEFKAFVLWPRTSTYFSRYWAGKYMVDGKYVLDSILSNATAHYIQLMFYITEEQPSEIEFEVYRANEIETYDTAFLHITTNKGTKFKIYVSHAVDELVNPTFDLKFDNANVMMNILEGRNELILQKSESVTNLGVFPPRMGVKEKIDSIISLSLNEENTSYCKISDVYNQMKVVNAIAEFGNVYELRENKIMEHGTTYILGLSKDIKDCFIKGELPSKLNLKWAKPSKVIKNIQNYSVFKGRI